MRPSDPRFRRAFTQIELLVVMSLIGILSGLLLPALQSVRVAAVRTDCTNNLRQIGLACHLSHDLKGRLPPGYSASGPYVDGNTDTAPGWGWGAYLLPFLEQEALYNQIDFAKPVGSSTPAQTVLRTFLCPADPVAWIPFPVTDATFAPVGLVAPSSYAATCGPDASAVSDAAGRGVFYRNSATRMVDIVDGASQTVMIGDRAWSQTNGTWAGVPAGAVTRAGSMSRWPAATAPAPALVLVHNNWINNRTDSDGALSDFSSNHPGGANFLFADGSVHFIRNITESGQDQRDFRALGTRDGDEVLSSTSY
jgi:prepilin-type processing-associated H-X9-DG protein/prepilin-type N-terminal cleavage/methylation domain-containing protein